MCRIHTNRVQKYTYLLRLQKNILKFKIEGFGELSIFGRIVAIGEVDCQAVGSRRKGFAPIFLAASTVL